MFVDIPYKEWMKAVSDVVCNTGTRSYEYAYDGAVQVIAAKHPDGSDVVFLPAPEDVLEQFIDWVENGE